MGLAILGYLLLLGLEQTPHTRVAAFAVIDRALVTSMLFFVLMLTAFLYYPVPVNRNLVVYLIGYTACFMAQAGGLLLLNNNYARVRQGGLIVVAGSIVSMLFWLVGLRREGEEMKTNIGHL
jgi:hypothetical protein